MYRGIKGENCRVRGLEFGVEVLFALHAQDGTSENWGRVGHRGSGVGFVVESVIRVQCLATCTAEGIMM